MLCLQMRELLPLLEATEHAEPRIVWVGSHEGVPSKYNPSDPQAADSGHSYCSVKYQAGLVGWGLNRHLVAQGYKSRSFSAHPGIVGSDMFRFIIGPFLYFVMFFTFYLVRFQAYISGIRCESP
jgi:NAD(P)-dependent dehydrogenase (short-subunit alcohol dehydrogenase family)